MQNTSLHVLKAIGCSGGIEPVGTSYHRHVYRWNFQSKTLLPKVLLPPPIQRIRSSDEHPQALGQAVVVLGPRCD